MSNNKFGAKTVFHFGDPERHKRAHIRMVEKGLGWKEVCHVISRWLTTDSFLDKVKKEIVK
jgi:hypothetical protein